MLEAVPRWYSPTGHLLATSGIGLFVVVVSILQIRDLRAIELLTVPIVFLISNFTEWHAHRNLCTVASARSASSTTATRRSTIECIATTTWRSARGGSSDWC